MIIEVNEGRAIYEGLTETDKLVRNYLNQFRLKCIMIDDLQSATPRYEAEKAVSIDENRQIISFFGNENIFPVFRLNLDVSSDNPLEIARTLVDYESEFICKVLMAHPVRESKFVFGPDFLNAGFRTIEIRGLVVANILLHPDDKDECQKKYNDIIDGNMLWTANMIALRHIPRGSAIFLPYPDEVGVFAITDDWRLTNCWSAQFSLAIQSECISWEKACESQDAEAR